MVFSCWCSHMIRGLFVLKVKPITFSGAKCTFCIALVVTHLVACSNKWQTWFFWNHEIPLCRTAAINISTLTSKFYLHNKNVSTNDIQMIEIKIHLVKILIIVVNLIRPCQSWWWGIKVCWKYFMLLIKQTTPSWTFGHLYIVIFCHNDLS